MRWFIAGELPGQLRTWFEQGMFAETDNKARWDHYLLLPGTVSLSVKLRGGNFEVKRRDSDFGIVPIGSRATGRLGLWRKWSLELVDKSGKSPDGNWLTIGKKRLLRKYLLRSKGLEQVDPGEVYSEPGCTVELTELGVRDQAWWSFGFEAFGPDENHLRDTFEEVATSVLNDVDHPGFRRENSFDYPEWIASLETAA